MSPATSKTLRVRVTETGCGERTGKPRAQADIIRKAAVPNIDIAAPVKMTHEELPGTLIEKWL